MRAPLFDSHAHLDFPGLFEELDDLLARAREAGVRRITTIGAGRGLEGSANAIGIARAHPGFVHATVGLHPHDASQLDDAARARLAELAASAEVVALGETGLDYHYDNSPREAQREAFRFQVGLARELGLPLVIHTREAREDTLAILREERAPEVGGILHCFSEDADFARAGLDLGFVCSFSGIVTFPKATAVREAARVLPEEALLVETDAPFLAPVPHRGKRNEPAFVGHTADELARLRACDPQALRAATWRNACRVYRLPDAE